MVEKKGSEPTTTQQLIPRKMRRKKYTDSQFKATISVDIVGNKDMNGATHFIICVTKHKGSGRHEQQLVYKRYNHWLEFHNSLIAAQFDNLPDFPPKKIGLFMTKSKTEERSNQLENYIREVVVRKDTRNSNE